MSEEERDQKGEAAETTASASTPQPAPKDPELVERSSHTWGMLCHLTALSGLIGVPFGQILGPLLVWLIKRDEYPFADDQGKESLNFQLSMLIYTLGSILLICLCVGIALIVLIQVLNLVLVIVASVKASYGERYRYPLTIRFFR